MARKTIIAGNWKMNLLPEEGEMLVVSLKTAFENKKNLEVVVFPPIGLIPFAREWIYDSVIRYGAQNCWHEVSGPYTGETSPELLKSLGCSYCLVGHSERREIFEESNELVGRKSQALVEMGIIPIVCVGESLAEREAAIHFEKIQQQVESVFEAVEKESWIHLVFAYEPIWAIGTGKTATPKQAEEIHQFIRKIIRQKSGDVLADAISILYGGSAKPGNAEELLAQDNIDGLLVGGASLVAEDFSNIIKAY
ncbi:triose-phosphate isomerase [bacterium]|nr:triose-phosphate isomerase [bacterium]